MSPSSLLIRRAGPDDAEASAKISAATFTETFGHLYPPEDLHAFLTEHHTEEVHRRVLADEAQATWLVAADGELVGLAKFPVGRVQDDEFILRRAPRPPA